MPGRPRAGPLPLYWERAGDGWRVMTLAGVCDVIPSEPVCHVSYYEADAFARAGRACGCRRRPSGSLLRRGRRSKATSSKTPSSTTPRAGEWRRARHAAPAFRRRLGMDGQLVFAVPRLSRAAGRALLGEYNGKFMCNQMVLRGGSCASPQSHLRATYRNFFPPDARWQFSGIRLAKDA